MTLDNIGHHPNDALFHAETTVLLRAASKNGGNLAGLTLEVFVEKAPCPNCMKVLPYVGLELGNPTVTFVSANGERVTMRNGKWD
jgi:tRNA(Arg) A34 adenosine deaminase TadA